MKGLPGMTLSADQVAGWIISYPMCLAVSTAMDEMCAEDTWEQLTSTDKHNEKGTQQQIIG